LARLARQGEREDLRPVHAWSALEGSHLEAPPRRLNVGPKGWWPFSSAQFSPARRQPRPAASLSDSWRTAGGVARAPPSEAARRILHTRRSHLICTSTCLGARQRRNSAPTGVSCTPVAAEQARRLSCSTWTSSCGSELRSSLPLERGSPLAR